MKWIKKNFAELTKSEMYELLKMRVDVFVVEQECPYPEVDGLDPDCVHIWGEVNTEKVAYCRIVPPHEENEYYSIGRVLIKEEYRGQGYARELMNYAIHVATVDCKAETISLHGQEHLRHFYGSFGFKEISEVYLEDGIPHVDMLRAGD